MDVLLITPVKRVENQDSPCLVSGNPENFSTPRLSMFKLLLVLPLSPPYGHVCDDRLRFDPLDRYMLP